MTKKKGENRVIPNQDIAYNKGDDNSSDIQSGNDPSVDENNADSKDDFEIGLPPLPSSDSVIPDWPFSDLDDDLSIAPPPIPNPDEIDDLYDNTTGVQDNDGPPEISINQIEHILEYNEEYSYLFIFGPGSSGKTVLISSILYYLDSIRSANNGDTLLNLNDPSIRHEKEGNRLWKELSTSLFNNRFPRGTSKVQVSNPFPRHINAHFKPANEKLKDFKFCLMDMAGDDLHNVDYESNEQLPDSIKVYVEQMPKENICFIYILDPKSLSYEKSEQLSIFNAFIDLLDKNDHTNTPLLFLVSKWDKMENDFEDAKDYLRSEYSPIWGKLNQQARRINYSEFSIGLVNEDTNDIRRYKPEYTEKVFNWFYKQQTGSSILAEEKLKKSFFRKSK